MQAKVSVLSVAAAVLVVGGHLSAALGQSYVSEPKTGDFVRELGRSVEQPAATTGEEGGLRQKGATRGLQINMAPAKAAQAVRPSVNFPVHFEFGSAELTPQAKAVLDELGAALRTDDLKPYRFRIVGHTDAIGSEEYNLDLSRQRAKAVERYLNDRFGIEQRRIEAVGLGKAQLYDPRNPTAGINRRVEIVREGRAGS